MDKRALIERAERAKYLLGDDLFAEMLTNVRLDALNALAEVNAEEELLSEADALAAGEQIVVNVTTYDNTVYEMPAIAGATRDAMLSTLSLQMIVPVGDP